MIKKIISLLSLKKNTLKGVFLDNQKMYGKIGNQKIPSVSYTKDSDALNRLFELANSENKQVNLTHHAFKYVSQYDVYGISFKISSKESVAITIENPTSTDIEYLIAIVMSRSFLLHHNVDFKKNLIFMFNNDNQEFDREMKKNILPNLLNRLAVMTLKQDPAYQNSTESDLKKIVQENPEYVEKVYSIVQNRWNIEE